MNTSHLSNNISDVDENHNSETIENLNNNTMNSNQRNINDIWNELINHPDYITTGPEELFTVQSLVEVFSTDWEEDNDDTLTEDQLVELRKMIVENKENISDTIWEFFRSPFEYSHWKDECDEYQQFISDDV
jgi:hypothetical protein